MPCDHFKMSGCCIRDEEKSMIGIVFFHLLNSERLRKINILCSIILAFCPRLKFRHLLQLLAIIYHLHHLSLPRIIIPLKFSQKIWN
jgi:hypothetical protein